MHSSLLLLLLPKFSSPPSHCALNVGLGPIDEDGLGDREMAQCLKVVAAFVEDLGSVLHTHMVVTVSFNSL